MKLIERAAQLCAAQLFRGPSMAADNANPCSLTRADWAAALVLRKLNLAEEVLAEHHESRHGGVMCRVSRTLPGAELCRLRLAQALPVPTCFYRTSRPLPTSTGVEG